jgi:hypothetical protein
MSHPELILRTLDSHLSKPAKLILYGRAALALGFPSPRTVFHTTMDVDAILPETEMKAIEAADDFWDAIEHTNHQLEESGLYLTHLFVDSQVILRPDWLAHLVPIHLPGLRFLELHRPSTEDLILTKTMRIDPQDRSDIEFLLQQTSLGAAQLDNLIASARVPDIPEILDAFHSNCDWLRRISPNHE